MGIGNVPIIGHGLGGIVGANFALAHPERVEQLMTVCTPLSGSDIARSLSGFSGGDNPAKVILGRRLKSYEEVDIEAAKTDANAVVQSVRYVMGHNLLDVLDDLDIPVLLVCGREDPIIQPPEDSVLEGLEINIYPFVFETAQHYPMLEETSKFDRLLRDFLVHKDNWDEIEVKDEWKRRMR